MEQKSEMTAKDISLSRLVATNPRKFSSRDLAPVRISMEEIGMLEPLTVYEEGETDLIIDGNKRYFILLGAGIESAPCILAKCPDTYTPSYQVIAVSPVERAKMIKRVLETVDENRVAAAIGVSSLKPILVDKFADGLNPATILAFEQGLLTKTALRELKSVTPKRQAEILKVLTQSKNYNLDVIRGQILDTPPTERVVVQKKRTPWQKNEEKLNAMTKKLEQVEKQSDFMSRMYHTYVSDITKQLTYIRGFLKDKKIEQYVTTKYPEMLKAFRTIMERE